MKISAFQELFNGGFQLTKESKVQITPSLEKRIERLWNDLFDRLGKEEQDLLDDLLFEMAGADAEKEDYFFKLGFRYGMLLAMETVFMEVRSPLDKLETDYPFFSERKKKKKDK